MTYMCQKCAASIGKTELTYKPLIDTEYGESNSKEGEETENWPRNSLRLNIRSTSPYPIHNKQTNSSVVGNKRYITVNKERNQTRKGSGAVIKKDNNKNLQNPSQHQVRKMKFLLQMVNQHQKWH